VKRADADLISKTPSSQTAPKSVARKKPLGSVGHSVAHIREIHSLHRSTTILFNDKIIQKL